MPMIVGDVIIDNSANESTKTGMAGSIYDALFISAQGSYVLPTKLPALINLKNEIGKMSKAIATGVVPYILDNLEARAVFTGGSDPGMQRDPAGSNDPCLGPVLDKTLFAKATLT